MDVSHTDHSHIIGKGGGNIKRGIYISIILISIYDFLKVGHHVQQ